MAGRDMESFQTLQPEDLEVLYQQLAMKVVQPHPGGRAMEVCYNLILEVQRWRCYNLTLEVQRWRCYSIILEVQRWRCYNTILEVHQWRCVTISSWRYSGGGVTTSSWRYSDWGVTTSSWRDGGVQLYKQCCLFCWWPYLRQKLSCIFMILVLKERW